MRRQPCLSILLPALLLAWGAALPARAQQSNAGGSLQERVSRLENILNSGTLVQLLDRVQALQDAVQSLRGQVEVDEHTLADIKKRQRDLYLDLDRRLQRLEGSAGTGQGSAQAGSSAAAPQGQAAGAASASPQAPAAPAAGQQTQAATAAGSTGSSAGATSGQAASPGSAGKQTAEPSSASAASSQQPASGSAAASSVAEQQAYKSAFDLLRAGNYDQAIQAFDGFLQHYPGGEYADNAQYWLGEAYYVTQRYSQALQEFQKLEKNYPGSAKLAAGMLKIGYIYDEMGKKDQAEGVLRDLVSRYPNTTAARLARERLQRLQSG